MFVKQLPGSTVFPEVGHFPRHSPFLWAAVQFLSSGGKLSGRHTRNPS
jgi:hypothetical protein